MEQNTRKTLKTCDWVMGASLFLLLVARISTTFYMSSIAEDTKADIDRVYAVYESNPMTRAILSLTTGAELLRIFIVPSLVFAIYFYYRHRIIQGKLQIEPLYFHSIFLFFMCWMDALREWAILLGHLFG